MYRVFYIELENFRGKAKTSFNFADESVTIFYGRNGSGKTTLLKIIHALLSLNDSILIGEDIKKATIVFKKISDGTLFNITATAKSDDEDEHIEWTTDSDEYDTFAEVSSSIVFGVNRGTTNSSTNVTVSSGDISRFIQRSSRLDSELRQKSNVWHEEFADYLNEQIRYKSKMFERLSMDFSQDKENHLMLESVSMEYVEASLIERYKWEKKSISQRVQKALFETLAVVLESSSSANKIQNGSHQEVLEKLNNHKGTLLEVLGQLEDNEVTTKIKRILSNYSAKENKNPFERKDLLLHLVSKMMDELEKGEGLLNTAKLVEEFNTYLTEGKQLKIDENGVYVKTKSSKHGIEKLSSGERHLLSFLTLFMINGRDRKIWMIDEPEISLHLEWQSKLLNILTRFVPDAQIIVATHSPAIAEYGTKYLVELANEKSKRRKN